MISESQDKQMDRLRWQCRRGLLELDCLFQDYLDQGYRDASEEERAQFRALLNEQDPDLQAWLLYGQAVPRAFALIARALRRD